MKYLLIFAVATIFLSVNEKCNEQEGPHPSEEELSTLSPKDTLLYFSKSACFGKCPEMEAVIYADLEMQYLGKRNIDPMGKRDVEVDLAGIQKIFAKAGNANFFDLEESYPLEGSVSDAQTIVLGLRDAENLKVVSYAMMAPDSLIALCNHVDKFIMDRDWTKSAPKR